MLPPLRTVPPVILIVVGVLALLPPISYFLTAQIHFLSPLHPRAVFGSYSYINLLFLTICWVLAGGLLLARKWAYFLLLIFAGGLLTYNAVLLLGTITAASWTAMMVGQRVGPGALIVNSLVILGSAACIVYFLHRETAAPYLSLLPRGWRRRVRNTVPIEVDWKASGERSGRARVVNISLSGLYLPIMERNLLAEGDLLQLSIDISEGTPRHDVLLNGRVLRTYVDEAGQAGVAVRLQESTSGAQHARLASFLQKHYSPRYLLNDDVLIEREGNSVAGKLYNISSRGAYVCTAEPHTAGATVVIEMRRRGIRLTVVVRWLNPDGEYGKAPGFGAEIVHAEPRLAFHLLKARLRLFAPLVR